MNKRPESAVRLPIFGISLLFAVLLMQAGNSALAQALPAGEAAPISTGFALPTTLGSLQYAISGSQSLVWGYYGSGVSSSTNVSGNLAYLSNSKQHPFSMVFSAGHSFSESGQGSYTYSNLGFSQVASIGRWNIILSDNVSYLPGTPAAGLSGVPGVGDLGINPVQVGADTGQGILTNFSNRVANTAAGSVQRSITGKTSVSASGSYSTTRFVDGLLSFSNSSSGGLDSSGWSAGSGINHQMDARNSFGGNYSYSKYTYSGNNNYGVATPSFNSQTLSGDYSHQFTRKLTVSVAAGPQWTGLGSSGSGSALSLFADASASYAGKSASASLAFVRSTNSGFGATGGAVSDAATFGVNRSFAVVWRCSASASYSQSSNLPVAGVPPFTIDTTVESIQVSRAIARSLSGYASYSLEHQSNPGALAVDLFSGFSQVVGFGLTFSPSALHLGRR